MGKEKLNSSNVCVVFVAILCLFIFLIIIVPIGPSSFIEFGGEGEVYYKHSNSDILRTHLPPPSQNRWKHDCFFYNCFEINTCQYRIKDMIKVHTYHSDSLQIDLPLSEEYRELIDTIKGSRYYEPHPQEACLFVPYFDTLNQRLIDVTLTSHMLSNLSWYVNK